LTDLCVFRSDVFCSNITNGLNAAEFHTPDFGGVLLTPLQEQRENRLIHRLIIGHEFFNCAERNLISVHFSFLSKWFYFTNFRYLPGTDSSTPDGDAFFISLGFATSFDVSTSGTFTKSGIFTKSRALAEEMASMSSAFFMPSAPSMPSSLAISFSSGTFFDSKSIISPRAYRQERPELLLS